MSSSVSTAISAVRRGEIVIVTDDESRENEGDLIIAAESATPERMAFFLRHTSGVICVSLPGDRLDALRLPLMVEENQERQGTAFTVSVDHASGVTSGISATDRALTIRALADPGATASDFARPGHVFPLRAQAGGVLARPGHTEAALDLSRLAGLKTAGVLCEVVNADRTRMARRPELEQLGRKYDLPTMTIEELIRYRVTEERLITQTAVARVPTRHGPFMCHAWRSLIDGMEHLAFTCGEVAGAEPALVRVHSECLTGDVFGSQRCDCGAQLDDALAAIAEERRGALIYMRGHEGRGIGISQKLAAYNLQDCGHDTVDANLQLGLPIDAREYGIGAQILRELGIQKVRLLTNNPSKCTALSGLGVEIVERVSLPPRATRENIAYLTTKRTRMGHLMDLHATTA